MNKECFKQKIFILCALCFTFNACKHNEYATNDINCIISSLPQYKQILDRGFTIKWDTSLLDNQNKIFRINSVVQHKEPFIFVDNWEKISIIEDEKKRFYILRQTLNVDKDIRELDNFISNNPQEVNDIALLAEILRYHFKRFVPIDIAVKAINEQQLEKYRRRMYLLAANYKQKFCINNFNNALQHLSEEQEQRQLITAFFGETDLHTFWLSFNGINYHIDYHGMAGVNFLEKPSQRCY